MAEIFRASEEDWEIIKFIYGAPCLIELRDRVEALEAARAEQQQQHLLGMTTMDLFVVLSGIHDMDRMNVARYLMRHPRIGPALRGAQKQAAVNDSLTAEPGRYITALRVARDALRRAGDEGRAALLVVDAALLDDTEPASATDPATAPEPTPAVAERVRDASLLDRLAWYLAETVATAPGGTDCTPFARDVLKAVSCAAALHEWDPSMAQQVTWWDVSHWLEREAGLIDQDGTEQASTPPAPTREAELVPQPTAEDMDALAEDMLGFDLDPGEGARLITRALERWSNVWPTAKPETTND